MYGPLYVVELPDSGGQVDQAAEEEPHCWRHLGKKELTNEREQFPLDSLVQYLDNQDLVSPVSCSSLSEEVLC